MRDAYTKHALKDIRSFCLAPASLVYYLAVNFRQLAFKAGFCRSARLPVGTICVGNVTMGGAGKTPIVIEVVRRLKEKGHEPLVISRGYGRKGSKKTIKLVADKHRIHLSFIEAGDEAVLLAENLQGTPIIVGSNRFAAGQYGLRRFASDIIVLDDGFQHFALKRDMNLVVFDATVSIVSLRLFPGGTLREPVSAVRRADAVILTKANLTNKFGDRVKEIRTIAPGMPVFGARYDAVGLKRLSEKKEQVEPEFLRNRKVLCVSAIGNPQAFDVFSEDILGVKRLESLAFRDHHVYTLKDMEDIEKRRRRTGAEWILTTEKDAVKVCILGSDLGRWWSAQIQASFFEEDSEEFDRLLGRLFTNSKVAV